MAAVNFIVFIALLCIVGSDARKTKFSFRSGAGSARRPNIIFILLDDMDTDLGSPNVMKKTQKILRQEGADFVNAFVTTPMCCPSRSSILTGKYAHNHHTFTNNLNCSSPSWRKGPERKSYARYLELAGYVTGYFGKYLNEYDGSWVPVGWNKWEGLLHNSRFYNYSIRHNTYKERHKMSYKEDYFTDLITNRSISFIRRTMATRPDSPFLAVVSHAAPHGPETAAPQYSTAFPDAKAPRYPNWNFISLDKQWILREKKSMDAQKIAFVDLLHRRRLQTLLSVDDSVARIFHTVQSLGIENETYIFLTSDHGYHLGQFGLVKGKSMPFESDIRVPFYVRGPVIPKNIRMKEIVLNIDLAPTFLDIAGVTVPRDMDGSSIMKLFRKAKNGRRSKRRMHVVWRDTILIERSRGWRRTKSMLESSSRNRFTSEGKPRNKTQTNKERKINALEKICSKTKHQSPCQPMQLWECVTVDGRPRLRKCRKNGAGPTRTPITQLTPSTAPTTHVKMCVCMKPRPGTQTNENQGDMFPYYDELLKSEVDYLSAKGLRRRSKRTRYSFINDRARSNRNEFNARRYYKELARAQKLQNRRAKSKMLQRVPFTGAVQKPNTSEAVMGSGVQDVVEEKLGKLKEKIWEIRMRLEALRDRKKKLLQISARDRLIEYPCPCNYDNNTNPEKSTTASVRNKGKDGDSYDDDDDDDDHDYDNNDDEEISPIRRRNKQPKVVSRKEELKKKKKVKTSLRRTKCNQPGLNCFYQTNDHWKLPPLWTGGDFCFCPNAANNSYWCIRTINATHNFLYCEFITRFLEFFDLNQDPYQLYNVIDRVSPAVLSQLHKQLERMRACKGGDECNHYHGKKYVQVNATSAPFTTPPLTSTSKQTAETTRMITDGKFTVSNNKDIAVLNKTNAIHLPTMPSNLGTSSKRTSNPLPSEGASEGLGNRSESFVDTPETTVDPSETTETSSVTTLSPTELRTTEPFESRSESFGNRSEDGESTVRTSVATSEATKTTTNVFPFTTLAPIEARIKTEELKPTDRKTSKRQKVTSFKKEERKEEDDDEKVTQSVVSSPKITDATSEAVKSSPNVFPFTTSAPTETRVKTDRLTTKSTVKKATKRRKEKTENGGRERNINGEKEKRKSLKKSRKSKKKSSKNSKSFPLPTNSTFPEKSTEIPRNISDQFSKDTKNESENETIIGVNVEKPTESAVTPTTSSDDVPTELVKTSEREPTSSVSTILPTSLATLSNEKNNNKLSLKEYSTIKPTRRKSAKRRKNGEKEGKETLKKSKKLRKTKKKSGKGVLLKNNTSSSGDNEEVLKLSENQTRIETKSKTERENESNKKGNNPSTEIPKKRNKKPSGKRLNRNSKKRSRKPTKRPTPSQISEEGVTEGGVVSPVDGGRGDVSPSDP